MKSLLKSNLIIISTMFFFMVGCRKDPHFVEDPVVNEGCIEDWCDEFPPAPEIGFEYTMQGTQYLAPSFNPNNGNEFVYIRWNGTNHAELVLHNLSTGLETIVLDPMSLGRPQWGKSDWIIFQNSDYCLWKIRPDGSNLSQLTNYPSANPIFSPDGNYFISGGEHPGIINTSMYRAILDINGMLVDSLRFDYDGTLLGFPTVATDSDFNGYFLYGDNTPSPQIIRGFAQRHGDTAITKLNSFVHKGDMWDAVANEDFLFFGTYWNPLKKMDLNTYTITAYRTGCQSRFYQHLSISPDGKSLIAQKVISTPYNNDQSIDVKNEIWLLDVNGCGEEKILGQ